MRRFLTGLGLGLLLGLAMPAPAATGPTATSKAANGTPTHAVLFGDSLAWHAADDYLKLFGGITPTTWTAMGGYRLADWQPQVLALNSLPTSTPFILALGGNDAFRQSEQDPIPTWKAVLDRVAASGRCVVVPDIERFDPYRQALWPRLEKLLRSYPTVRIAPWWTVTAQHHPEWRGPDGIHHTDAGQQAYAWALWLGLQECYR